MIKILFIKVNPIGTTNLFLDVEENNIEDSLVSSANRDYFDIKSKGAVTKDMLHSNLETYKPDILHISGHGSDDGVLYFHDVDNHKKELSLDMFSEFIQNYKPNLKCVFMNACFSLMNTKEFNSIDNLAVIGMNNEVPNDTALSFSRAFYTSFFEGKSVSDSFRTAVDVVGLDGFGEENIPIIIGQTDLKHNEEIDKVLTIDNIIPPENFEIARTREKKRKYQYHILIGIVVIVVLALVGTSLYNDYGSFSLLGFTPLGVVKWIKDKLDGVEDSLSLLEMLENEIKAFLELLNNPPVPNASETVTNLKQQFWDIVT